MRRRSALIATSLTLLAGLVAVPAAGAQGGPGGGGTGGGGGISGGGGTSGGGGGGGGRSAQCFAVSFDPATATTTVVCTTLRA
jgi:hypothetical protein